MENKDKIISEPRIGIWWDNGVTIVAFSHSAFENATRTGQLLDSNYNHSDKWKTAAKRLNKSQADEYFVVPRGRVLLNRRSKEGIVLHGPATTEDRLMRIADEFNLSKWRAEIDSHYFTGKDADQLFEDEQD